MVWSEARVIDLFVLSLVPAALIGIYLQPQEVRQTFALSYLEPTLVSTYAAHYVHFSFHHLITNLVGYFLIATTGYLLSLLSHRRREFYLALLTYLVVFPFVISFLNVLVERPRVGFGFSGIVLAFLGFLPIALFWYLEATVDRRFDLEHAPILFFLGVGVIAVWGAPLTIETIAVSVATAVGIWMYSRTIRRDLTGLTMDRFVTGPGRTELALAGFLLFATFPFAAFPADPIRDGAILNLYTHLLGFCLGFIVPFTTFALVDRVP